MEDGEQYQRQRDLERALNTLTKDGYARVFETIGQIDATLAIVLFALDEAGLGILVVIFTAAPT